MLFMGYSADVEFSILKIRKKRSEHKNPISMGPYTNRRHEALLHIYPFSIDLSKRSPPIMSTVTCVSIMADFHRDHDPTEQFLVFHFFFYEGTLKFLQSFFVMRYENSCRATWFRSV